MGHGEGLGGRGGTSYFPVIPPTPGMREKAATQRNEQGPRQRGGSKESRAAEASSSVRLQNVAAAVTALLAEIRDPVKSSRFPPSLRGQLRQGSCLGHTVCISFTEAWKERSPFFAKQMWQAGCLADQVSSLER